MSEVTQADLAIWKTLPETKAVMEAIHEAMNEVVFRIASGQYRENLADTNYFLGLVRGFQESLRAVDLLGEDIKDESGS